MGEGLGDERRSRSPPSPFIFTPSLGPERFVRPSKPQFLKPPLRTDLPAFVPSLRIGLAEPVGEFAALLTLFRDIMGLNALAR